MNLDLSKKPNPGSSAANTASTAAATAPAAFSIPALLTGMLRSAPRVSDLFFTPGKPPMVEVNGRLSPVGARMLTSEDTRHIATDLIGNNQHALGNLREQGSCDVSYSLAGTSRFRVNVFMQRRQKANGKRKHNKGALSFAFFGDSERYQEWVLKKSLNRTPFHLRACGCGLVLSAFD